MDKRTSTNGNKVLGYIAKRIAVRDANTTCPFLGYFKIRVKRGIQYMYPLAEF